MSLPGGASIYFPFSKHAGDANAGPIAVITTPEMEVGRGGVGRRGICCCLRLGSQTGQTEQLRRSITITWLPTFLC